MFSAFKNAVRLHSTQYPKYPAGSLERVRGLQELAKRIFDYETKAMQAEDEGQGHVVQYNVTQAQRERTAPHGFSIVELENAIEQCRGQDPASDFAKKKY